MKHIKKPTNTGEIFSVKRKNMSLSVVVPCYNEVDNVGLFFKEFKGLIKYLPERFEMLIIDGGSTDGTLTGIQNSLQDPELYDLVKVIQNPGTNKGYGADIVYGLNHCSGDLMAWTHFDLQTDFQDVLTAFNIMCGEADPRDVVIKGRRRNRPFFDSFFTFGMQLITYALLRKNISDINAQPKLFTREFFQNYVEPNAPNDFSLDLFILFQASQRKLRIKEFPVFFKDRVAGLPKGGGGGLIVKYRLVKRTFNYMVKLKRSIAKQNLR